MLASEPVVCGQQWWFSHAGGHICRLRVHVAVWPTTKGRIKMVLDPAEENLGLRYLGQSKIVPRRKGWNLEPSQPRWSFFRNKKGGYQTRQVEDPLSALRLEKLVSSPGQALKKMGAWSAMPSLLHHPICSFTESKQAHCTWWNSFLFCVEGLSWQL